MANKMHAANPKRAENLQPYRLAETDKNAAAKARKIKQAQKQKGLRFEDSTTVVRADRDSR